MKVFHCDHCGHLVFFENTHCVNCGRLLAFLPDLMVVGSLEPLPDDESRWRSPLPHAAAEYRLCDNYRDAQVCNWAIDSPDAGTLCRSCRLTRVVPDQGIAGHAAAWYRLEVAKRRLVYTLLSLELPFDALAFEFLADVRADGQPVLTGHANGVITIRGTTCSFWKLSAQTPMMKPNRLNVIDVSTRKPSIHKGCAIEYGTNRRAVTRIRMPSMIDLVAAAPT